MSKKVEKNPHRVEFEHRKMTGFIIKYVDF